MQHLLLLVVPLVFAVILSIAKLRSWSLIAGVIGGVLLGPAVLGSVAPAYWEEVFQGGVIEHEHYDQLVLQQETDILAANKLGVNPNVILQMKAAQQFERGELQESWNAAQWSDQRTFRGYAITLIILILISGRMRCSVSGSAPPMMLLSVGVWAAIVPCGVVAILAFWLWNPDVPSAIALGACLAAGPWTVSRWEQRAADESEQGGAALMLRCGRVAWLIATCVALYATWQIRGAMALVWLLPLLMLPVIWLVPTKKAKWFTAFIDYAAIPSIVATTLVLIHPIGSLSIWPTVVVLLLCADARWLGGIIGLGLLGGRNSENAMRLAIPLVDSGVSQLCMASLLFGVGVLPANYALAAVIGAVFLDRTAPIRMKLSSLKNSP